MSVAQFFVTAVISILVTVPAVLLIPRARQSPLFDRVLWIGTGLLAFLSASFVLGNLREALASLSGWVIGETPVIPALIGAAVGAFALNGLLWAMDWFGRSSVEENAAPAGADENVDAGAGESAEEDSSSPS